MCFKAPHGRIAKAISIWSARYWDYDLNGTHVFVNDNNQITRIIAHKNIALSDEITHIESDYDKVISFLGDNYKTKIYDYGQGLKENIYFDRKHHIQLEVVFYKSSDGNQIAFIIISSKDNE